MNLLVRSDFQVEADERGQDSVVRQSHLKSSPKATNLSNRIMGGRREDDDKQPRCQQALFHGVVVGGGGRRHAESMSDVWKQVLWRTRAEYPLGEDKHRRNNQESRVGHNHWQFSRKAPAGSSGTTCTSAQRALPYVPQVTATHQSRDPKQTRLEIFLSTNRQNRETVSHVWTDSSRWM